MKSKKEIEEFLSNIIYKSSNIGYIEKYLRCKHCYFIPFINIHPIDGQLKIDVNCNCGASIMSFIEFFKKIINSLCSDLKCEKCNQKNNLSSNLFYYHTLNDMILCNNCFKQPFQIGIILRKNNNNFYYYLDSYKYNSNIKKFRLPKERNKILVNKSDYKCINHLKENICGYCFDCRINICENDIKKEIKLNHKYVLFNEILNTKNIEEIEKLKDNFLTAKLKIVNEDNDIKDKLIEKMNDIYNESILLGDPLFENENDLLNNKKEIEKSYNLYKERNRLLSKLIESFFTKFKNALISNKMNYVFYTNILNNTNFNQNSYGFDIKKIDRTNILKAKLMLIKFYNENFIINYTNKFYTPRLKNLSNYEIIYNLNNKNVEIDFSQGNWNSNIDDNFIFDFILFLQDGRIAISQKSIQIRIYKNFIIDKILKGHTATVSCAIQLNNSNIVSCSCDYEIKIWDLGNYSCIYTINNDNLQIPREYITIINLPNLCFATCDTNGEIKFFKYINKKIGNINCKEIKKISVLINRRITSLLYLEKNKIMTSIYDNKSIIFWTINPPQKQCIFDYIIIYSSNSIAKYNDNIIFIVSGSYIYIIDFLFYQIKSKINLIDENIYTIFIRKNKNILFSTIDGIYEYEYDYKKNIITEKGKLFIGESPYIFSAMGENDNGDIIIIDSVNSFILQ